MLLNRQFLIAESETEEARERRKQSTGRSNGESYVAALKEIAPDARCEIIRPVEDGPASRPSAALSDYDAVFLSGSPLHVYRKSPEVRRHLDFMRAVFASRTPSFGSCAGLQVAVAAAGGSVRENRRGHEVAFARRILPTEAGRSHPLLAGRPAVFDAGAIHSDEVERLPDGATLLATNGVTTVQAAEVRMEGGVFWGVQYHPELPLEEIADALRRQRDDIVEQRLARDRAAVESYAILIEELARDPTRRDLAWRLGVDEQVTDRRLRQTELRNFIEHLVDPTRLRRGRE
jgi:GMP synthase (glutamine-hydrolysing)